MKSKASHPIKFFIQTISLLLAGIAPITNFAQNSRSTPGQNLGENSNTSSQNKNSTVPLVGDYVALDENIRNDVYGTIDFPNADLREIIKAISKLANKNFILDRKIEGRKITILSPEPVTKQEAYNAFLSALYANELTVVSVGSFLKVIESKNAIQSNIRVFVGDYVPSSEEIVTVIYPLKHLDAEEIQRFLTDLVPRNARITNYPNTNTLVMTDTGLNLRRVISVLKSVDVPGFEDQLETIQIKYASAKGIAQLIDSILDAQGASTGPAARRRTARPGGGAAQKTRGGGTISKIVPDDRTNSLVVLANGRGVREVRDLVAKLDTPNAAGGGNIHVYYCKNAVAKELATTITALISGAQQTRQQGSGGQSTAPVFAPPPSPTRAGQTASSGDTIQFEGQVRVAPDEATNSLVVVASGADYAALKRVLEKLDIAQRQVYVEATIMEIAVVDSKAFSVGVNIAAPGIPQAGGFIPSKDVANNLAKIISTPAGVQGMVSAITAGTRRKFTVGGAEMEIPTVAALIHAIEGTGHGNVLHQPQILTSDNKDALIEIKERIPVNSGSTTDPTTGFIGSNVGKEEVIISLKITPQIGTDNDLIKLKVEQQIDDFTSSPTEAGPNIKTTSRKANTTVTIRDGGTIVVGGLQKTISIDTNNKFPLLGSLPIIGWLFKESISNTTKTNLVLFLTPHVINSYSDLQRITKAKVEDRYQLGRQQFDPKDKLEPQIRKFRDKVETEIKNTKSDIHFGFKPSENTSQNTEDRGQGGELETIDPLDTSYMPSLSPPLPPSKILPQEEDISFLTPTAPTPLIDQRIQEQEPLESGNFLEKPMPFDDENEELGR